VLIFVNTDRKEHGWEEGRRERREIRREKREIRRERELLMIWRGGSGGNG
jgi:hypothetical protein